MSGLRITKACSYAGCRLEKKEIRTSCLGFGDHYNEDLMTGMANASSGNFYGVDSAEKLPLVFEAELEGALRIAVQNLRVRVPKKISAIRGDAELKGAPAGRKKRTPRGRSCLRGRAFVRPICPRPANPIGQTVRKSQALREKKFSPSSSSTIWLAKMNSPQYGKRVIRLSATPNEDEVKVDESVLPIVSAQKQAGRSARRSRNLTDISMRTPFADWRRCSRVVSLQTP